MFIAFPLILLLNLLNPFQKIKFDVVHLFGPLCLPFIPLLPLFWLRGVKIYVSYHVYLEAYRKAYFQKLRPYRLEWIGEIIQVLFIWLYFIPFTVFANVIGIPSKTADFVVFKYCKNIHIMKSGLNLDTFTPINQVITCDPPILVYVGRLALEKNISFLINALSYKSSFTPSLLIIGDGPERNNLTRLAKRIVGDEQVYCNDKNKPPSELLSLTKSYRVVFVGMVFNEDEIVEYYAKSSVFVSASSSETFGFTVAESLSCGTPTVIPKAFENVYSEVGKWMFEDGDYNGYINKIELVLNEKGAREFSRTVGLGFGIDKSVDDLISVYTGIVEEREFDEFYGKKGLCDGFKNEE